MDKEKLQIYYEKYKAYKQRSWNPRTARDKAYPFRLLFDYLGDKSFDRDSLLAFFNHLQDLGLSESTRSQNEKTIRAFVKWLFNEDLIEKNFSANIERTKIHRKPKILPSQEEILGLIEQVTEIQEKDNKLTRFTKGEYRSCLKFIVVACGGRNYETSRILRKDVSLSTLEVELVAGKGGSRLQKIPPIPWLIEDLEKRVNGLRTEEELQILNDKTHFQESAKDRLFVVSVDRLRRYMRQIGVLLGRPIIVHDLRRIFARDLKENNISIDDIRDAMGHKNIETTMGYLEYDTSTQARTLKNGSSEARKYRTPEEKAKELVAHAWDLGRIIKGGNLKGRILTLEVELT